MKHRTSLVIARRELGAYFSSPVVYIVTGLFLIFSGFLFFSTFFLLNRAEIRSFFSQLPLMFSFFIPALTMRLFAEETRSGSFETLMTLPVSPFEIALGKFLAAWASSCILLVPTFVYCFTISFFGDLDMGPVVGGYTGAVLLAAAFSAIGIFASSLTRNQIIAFFTAFAVCAFLSLIRQLSVLLPSSFAGIADFISSERHFSSIARGIIDSRDLVYFFSVTALFFVLTVRCVGRGRSE